MLPVSTLAAIFLGTVQSWDESSCQASLTGDGGCRFVLFASREGGWLSIDFARGPNCAVCLTCLRISVQYEKMNEVDAELMVVMAGPDLNRGEEGFSSAEGRSDLEFEQERPRKIIHVDMDAF
jgi:hypothetical protein